MKLTLSLLLVLSSLSTVVARADVAGNEMLLAQNFQIIQSVLPKLHLEQVPDFTLPDSVTPYTDWNKAHGNFISTYSNAASWLSDSTQLSLACAAVGANSESPKDQAKREKLSESVVNRMRNFNVMDYVSDVPGFKDCGLDEAETAAVYDYSQNLFSVNVALRKRKVSAQQKAFVITLEAALDKLANYEGVVKRGTRLTEAMRAKYQVGAVVGDRGFMSTSRAENYMKQPDIFEIQSKTGKYIAPLSAVHFEEEVLFRPGTQFRILAVTPDAQDSSITHYQMEEESALLAPTL